MQKPRTSFWFVSTLVLLLILVSTIVGAVADRLFVFRPLDYLMGSRGSSSLFNNQFATQSIREVVREESVIVSVAEMASESVVTISILRQEQPQSSFFLDPFGLFDTQPRQSQPEIVQRDIGTGFVVDENGLIVTNKHVVSDTSAQYKVITKDGEELEVQRIYRDPVNDLAILRVSSSLQPLILGDSDQLKVGQSVVAIGTALGTFRHTVTTGVISGLGRGIEAGTAFRGFVERLDNVIQTDAAINPGNSGGPLLNLFGEVIGVNVAVSATGQNIGFAIPINTIKESLAIFNETGQFDRPFLGVQYRMIPSETAILNDISQGAYIVEVVPNSSAFEAGIQPQDIVTRFDGQEVRDVESGLAELINRKRVGDSVRVEIWRAGETLNLQVTLRQAPDQ